MEPSYHQDHRINPAELQSQATSVALESNRPASVPCSEERQVFAGTRREVPPPLMVGSTTPTPTHPSALMNAPPRGRELLVDTNSLRLSLLLVDAEESNIQIALDQAILTPDTLLRVAEIHHIVMEVSKV
jgi:hypothetical protein